MSKTVAELTTLVNSLVSQKSDIRDAIIYKGVNVPSNATVDDYPTYISQIAVQSDFTVNYIESDASTYIQLPSYAGWVYDAKMEFQFYINSDSPYRNICGYHQGDSVSSGYRMIRYLNQTANAVAAAFPNDNAAQVWITNSGIGASKQLQTVTIDNTVDSGAFTLTVINEALGTKQVTSSRRTTEWTDTPSTYPFYIFGDQENNEDRSNIRMYYFKMWHGSNLIIHLVPCIHFNQDGTYQVGMHDNVSGNFFGNSNSSGSFAWG